MKRLISILLLFVLLLCPFASRAGAEDAAYNWYVRRAGNCRPQMPEEDRLLARYDGYFMDRKLSDDSERKVLYLTFDAGYENGNVAKILDALKEAEVPGAFFILDNLVLREPALVERMANEGHLVCNHTKNHKDMTKLSSEQMKKNLLDLELIYEQKTGRKMAKYFRFPEGRYNEATLETAKSLGYHSIFWSLAYADWDNDKQPNPKAAIRKILENTHNGAVVLLHPTSSTNAEILPTLIAEWRKMGYEFGTLDELTAK